MPFFIFYLTRNELNFLPGHSSSAPTCGENVSCRSSRASGTLHTFSNNFLWQFLIFNFLFCNLSAFLLIYKHSQSIILTEFKGLFLVRHRSSCRPIGRVEIQTANQSWEALLVNWFHPFMSKPWSIEAFHSWKLSKMCCRRLKSYATSNKT